MKRVSKYHLCINDIILTVAMVMAAVIILIIFTLVRGETEGDSVVVSISGQVYGTYLLSDDQIIEIDNNQGKNIIEIKDSQVKMLDADCPDGYCISSGKINRNGESIVCLPHKLVVEVKMLSNDNDFDVIAH